MCLYINKDKVLKCMYIIYHVIESIHINKKYQKIKNNHLR